MDRVTIQIDELVEIDLGSCEGGWHGVLPVGNDEFLGESSNRLDVCPVSGNTRPVPPDEPQLSDTQEQILDAAMSCISRDGIDGASMRSVAREADVSLGLLSYHFEDKRSLIVAAFQLATDRLLETTLESIDDTIDPEERVRAFVRGAFHGGFLEPDYLALRTALWAISRTDAEIAAVEAGLYKRYAREMARLIRAARPDLTATQARHRTTDVIVTQNGLWLNWARYRSRTDLRRGLDRCDSIALE